MFLLTTFHNKKQMHNILILYQLACEHSPFSISIMQNSTAIKENFTFRLNIVLSRMGSRGVSAESYSTGARSVPHNYTS